MSSVIPVSPATSPILLALATNAKTYTAEAVIELSVPLWLGPEFLGLLKPARIGGVDVHVVLPDFKRDTTEAGTVLHSRAQVDWISFFGQRNSEDDRDWPFGGVVSWKGAAGGISEFSAHRLLAMPKGQVTLAEARRLKEAVDDWVELWIEVVAREDLHRGQIKVERQGQSAVVWLDRGKKLEGEFLSGEHRIMLNFGSILALTPWQWGKLLARASDGAEPPEAHTFLRDARHAKSIGHYRRSVLDSATAAELSLAKLRDHALTRTSTPLAEYVGKNVTQIDRLATFLRAMGESPPDNITEAIAQPRNKAIHEGYEPDDETAAKALRKAEEVVDLAFPWKKLL